MVPDRITREIHVAAPIERVWAVLTEAEHVARWFGDAGAEIDLRPGGRMLFRWREHGDSQAIVERLEPPRRFSYRWNRTGAEAPRPGTETLVEFTLTPEGAGTRLRVVESGFAQLALPAAEQARYAEENAGGWRSELEELRAYVSAGVAA